MEADNRLKIIIAGLVLAAIAIVYLIFSQRVSNQNTKVSNNTAQVPVQQMQPVVTPTPTPPPPSPTPAPGSLGRVAPAPDTTKGGQPLPTTKGGQPLTKGGISQLPATGSPIFLISIFSASAAIAGWFLRKYPH